MDFEESFMNAQEFDCLLVVEPAHEANDGATAGVAQATTTTSPPPAAAAGATKRGRKPGKKSSDKVDIRAKLGDCADLRYARLLFLYENAIGTPHPDRTVLSSLLPSVRSVGIGRFSVKKTIPVRIERSRQSARECRARKKLRYQYLEELVTDREKAVIALRQELDKFKIWCVDIDEGNIPDELPALLEEMDAVTVKQESCSSVTM